MNACIPETGQKRVVVLGGGFAGITLVEKLDDKKFQIVLVDKNNYHQFQPLIYQVAASGLEASSVCFSFRRLFRKKKNFYFRLASAESVDATKKVLKTSVGDIRYDYLIVCAGATTNFFGNKNIEKVALPMKSVEEAIYLRNRFIENNEEVLTAPEKERDSYRNVVIVGGGATGVEISGIISEMRRFVMPKNFHHLDPSQVHIYLIAPSILASMTEKSSSDGRKALEKMGVEIIDGRVSDYDEAKHCVLLEDGSAIRSRLVIWVSGIKAVSLQGIPAESIGRGGRILCDEFMQIKGLDSVYAAGDIALTSEAAYPDGHPQLAQVAMQQAKLIAKNINAEASGDARLSFKYKDLGSMATIGRNRAVADIAGLHFSGFIAWAMWMLIHLRSILGVRNKIFILLDWIINYFNFIGSMRLILFKGKR